MNFDYLNYSNKKTRHLTMNNFSYEELRTEHERVQDDMISMMKSDLSIIKKLEKENKKLKKENEYFKRVLEEEQDSHSKTLNNISETFNFTKHRKKQAQLHAGTFNKPESVEGHYRTLIGDWYMICIKEDNKRLKKEEEEQLAAVECLKFMDFTYKDGRWFDADCESEEEEEEQQHLTMEGHHLHIITSDLNICICDNCDGQQDVDDPFFIFENKDKDTMCFCQSCGDDLRDEMKEAGWSRDDDYYESVTDSENEEEEEEEDIFKAENDKYDKLEKQCSCGCCDEENNKAFAKNIVQDIIDNALNKVTH